MDAYHDIVRLKERQYTGEQHISVKKKVYREYPQHWHDYFEIEVVISGTGTHIYNGTARSLKKGDVYLLTPVDFHEIKADEPVEILNVSFGSVWLSEQMRMVLYSSDFVKLRSTNEREFHQFVSAIELLQQECEIKGPGIRQLLEYILSRFVPAGEQTAAADVNKEYMKGIMKAVVYMEQHFREPVSLDTLSEISGYHPTYFSKMFRKVTGENYIERLTELRLDYAKMLLKKGVSVSEACFHSGFSSLSHFVSVFKKRCGMTPSAYRDSKKNSKKP